jgi:hypothetical protein
VFERFTDRARSVVVLAQEESRRLGHNYIGTEHILLGLLAEGDGIAFRALQSLSASLDGIRDRVADPVAELVGRGARPMAGHIPFRADAKSVLEYSSRESLQLGHNYIGTEHILLGLVRPGQDNVATQVLLEFGIEHSRARQAVVELLGNQPSKPGQLILRTGSPPSQHGTRCSFCGNDVWDTRYYVAGEHGLICQDCVEDARGAVEDATRRGAEPGALHLPPRVTGDPPDNTSVPLIVDAFMEVFGAKDRHADVRDAPLEDVEGLLSVIAESQRRYPDIGARDVAVSRIRFRSEHAADVRFLVLGFPYEGNAIRDGQAWKVSRDTFCNVLRTGGIQCRPRDPS